ncbi:MAG TPA: RtcB family protein [Polyangiaceae bacterium]|nr:RtcB family protein [Polyangiaceae bacterium]
METRTYDVIANEKGAPVKAWTRGVPVEADAVEQLKRLASLPFVHRWVAAMPDVHAGVGATVGSVVATDRAIIPAAVGVDIGCGMMALETTLRAEQLPDDLGPLRAAIEAAVPHGRTDDGGPNDRGAWRDPPPAVAAAWAALAPRFQKIVDKHPRVGRCATAEHLGTLGTGNHFIEVCLDERGRVWLMLHSGSRGLGNRVGRHFIELAKAEMRRYFINLPDADLAYLVEGTAHLGDYLEALSFAQDFAAESRALMMRATLAALRALPGLPPFEAGALAVNCHHNYVAKEHHYGKDVYVTRKGAVRAREGDLGVIPGSMGARSFVVRGRGNAESFHSCSHGAGRAMSRSAARRAFTVEDHAKATAGVECRKDADVIDETPMAYKSIDDVMRAQQDLVEVVHTLRQVVCVKG